MVMNGIYGKAQLNNSANKWGGGVVALVFGTPVNLPNSQSRAPSLLGPSPMVKTALDVAR